MTRRARTKTRRPKFLSLRRQLASPEPPPPPPIMSPAAPPDHLMDPDPSVACLLDAGAGGSATIADLLGAGDSPTPPPESPASSSMNWDEADDGRLARRALRGRERWVFCCSSPSTSSSEEVASGGAPPMLSLKLDYDEILAAWSGRGSLYIGGGEGPQVVPELHDAAVLVDVGNAWVVPEAAGNAGESREARVMRYKEKRRSRLFAKRIRYQVRKLNAEKRPRLKGRFVKKINDA